MYNPKLIKILDGSGKTQNIGLTDAIVYPIPDDDRAGYMDSREVQYLIDRAEHGGHGASIEEIRADHFNKGVDISVGVTKTQFTLDAAPECKVYVYRSTDTADKVVPAVMYVHGGSFFAGACETVENACKLLAERSWAAVFSIDYALAPEYPFPCAFNQCVNLLDYLKINAGVLKIDAQKLTLAGDSAGANICAALALYRKEQVRLQLLWYPVVTLSFDEYLAEWKESDFDISDEHRNFILTRLALGRIDTPAGLETVRTIARMYIPPKTDAHDPRISPYFGDLTSVPKCIIFAAEFDGLRYHGEVYTKALRDGGNDVTLIRYKGTCHAFVQRTGISPQAEHSIMLAAQAIKNL